MASFQPQLDGKVYALVSDSSTNTLYVGGSFTGGFAILDATTGAPEGDAAHHRRRGACPLSGWQRHVRRRPVPALRGERQPQDDGPLRRGHARRGQLRAAVHGGHGGCHRHGAEPEPCLRRRAVLGVERGDGGQGRGAEPGDGRARYVLRAAHQHHEAARRGHRGAEHEGVRGLRWRLQPPRPVRRRGSAGVRLLRGRRRPGGPPGRRSDQQPDRPAGRRPLRRQPEEELHAGHDPDGSHRRVPGQRRGRRPSGRREPDTVLERLRQRARCLGVPGDVHDRPLGGRRLPQGLVTEHRRRSPTSSTARPSRTARAPRCPATSR